MGFLRITKRDDLPRRKEIMITLLAILLSIVFCRSDPADIRS